MLDHTFTKYVKVQTELDILHPVKWRPDRMETCPCGTKTRSRTFLKCKDGRQARSLYNMQLNQKLILHFILVQTDVSIHPPNQGRKWRPSLLSKTALAREAFS